MLLRLNRNHPTGEFHRIVREKKKGKPDTIKKTLIFAATDDPVELSDADLEAVQADIDKGVLVEVDARGKPVPPPAELSEYDRGFADGHEAGLADASHASHPKPKPPKNPRDAQDADQG
jgi:hypothetical protein